MMLATSRICVVLAALCVPAFAASSGAAARDQRLVAAAERRDLAAVRALVRQRVDPDVPQPDGATALHWAAHRDEVGIARELVSARANVDAVNDYGVTPLTLAAENRSEAMARLLLDAGADPNLALPSGETPLLTASRTGATAAASLLIDRGARVNHRESVKGQTALMWAVAFGHLDTARMLVSRGADVRAQSTAGMTPLLFATQQGDHDTVKFLLERGASLTDATKTGITPLLMATVRGHSRMVEFLLDAGADPNVATAGFTPLHWAVGRWETSMTFDYPEAEGDWKALGGLHERKLEVIEALVAHGADINARVTKAPPRFGINMFLHIRVIGATPFWIAAMSADVEVMRLLVARGADPSVVSEDNITPLMVAAGMGRIEGDSRITDVQSLEAVRFCVEQGNPVNATAKSGETALHGAAWFGLDDVARFLVERGADMTIRDGNNQTPEELAEGTVRTLLFRTHPRTATVLRDLAAARAK